MRFSDGSSYVCSSDLFWALALYRSDDYARAGVPMLPVVAGDRETRRQILIYSLILAPLGILPALIGLAGGLYGVVAAILGGLFVLCAWRVWREQGDRAARQLFRYSLLYLFLLFALLLVDGAVGRGT